MSTAIANRDGEVILSAAEVELVKKTVASGASDEELRLFLHDCRRQGVHPLDKLIHFTKRGGRYTPITSIDFMRMRAADSGELAGNDDPVYAFKDGETVLPISATVTVYRLVQGQRCAFTATARWAEYKPPQGQDMMWMKMPQLMLGKCAEALALRKAFPKQLHGVYERAEMAQAGKEDDPTATQPVGRARNNDDHRKPAAVAEPVAASDRVSAGAPDDGPRPLVDEQETPELVEESERLLPTLEDDERAFLISEIQSVLVAMKRERKITDEDVLNFKGTYLGGRNVDIYKVDVAALASLKKYLKNRFPKAPWRKVVESVNL